MSVSNSSESVVIPPIAVPDDDRHASALFPTWRDGGLPQGFFGRHDCELGDPVGASRFLAVHVSGRVEVWHFAGNLRRIAFGVEEGDAPDTGAGGEQAVPVG